MDKKFKQIYYSDGGYWRGKSAIQRLAKASGSTKEVAEKWLLKQPLYQMYLPAPKYIPRPNASMSLFAKPNDIHQSDLLSLPHDKFKKKTYKYALNIVDVASRYKGSYQLTTKNAKEVAQAFQWIYENTPLNYPKTLIVDDGKEFYGDMTKLMEKHDVMIKRGDPSQHRSQEIVERFNRTLADRLFTYQYHKELEDPSKSNREWVSRLQNVVSSLSLLTHIQVSVRCLFKDNQFSLLEWLLLSLLLLCFHIQKQLILHALAINPSVLIELHLGISNI